jgi:ribosome-binding factor A
VPDPVGSKRNERLKELFLQEINAALRNVNGINANGILTLTGAELTRDMKILNVFYSVLGTLDQRKRKDLILSANARDIRTQLFKRLRLKDIPEIVFKFDETPEKAAQLEDIFSKIRSEHEKTDENPGS